MAVETPAATPESSAPSVDAQQAAIAQSGSTEVKADGQPQAAQGTAPVEEKLSIMGVEIEKSKVPPELLEKVDGWNKAYTEKSQAYSEADKKAKQLEALAQNPSFQKWYWDQVKGVQPEPTKVDPFDLTPETQAELLSDPRKFKDFIKGVSQSVMNEVAIPAAQQAQYEAQVLRSEREVDALVTSHPDAQDLIDNDQIQAIVNKYPDIGLEDAYWLAKRDFTESESTLKAHQRVEEKVNGSTLKPSGAPTAEKVKLISGKGLPFDERMRIAAEHAYRGERIKFTDS